MALRAVLTTIFILALLAAPLAANAQPTGKVPRVGFLSSGSPSVPSGPGEAFRQGLRELGWVEGQNIVIEYRLAEGRYDRLPELAAQWVQLKVDVIAAGGTAATTAAKNATGIIPIVMMSVGDPVGVGLIASLARPGGNVTGLAVTVGSETYGKAMELLKETLPKIRRVAILSNPANPSTSLAMKDVKAAARALGLELQLLEARGPSEFDGAFAAMTRERAEALFVVSEAMFYLHRARLAELAARNKLPSMYTSRDPVKAGAFISYGSSFGDIYRRAAVYVDKVLKGAKPADLPVEQPTKFELVINLKTAKALGLTIPPAVLARADQVIE
jgi:putative ABC transport system substrate-binding protein